MIENAPTPVVPLRKAVLFPGQLLPLTITRQGGVRAVEAAAKIDGKVFVVTQSDESEESSPANLSYTGVIAKVGMINRGANGVSLILQGQSRARAVRFQLDGGYIAAKVNPVAEMQPIDANNPAFKALFEELRERAAELGELYEIPSEVVAQVVESGRDPGAFADQIAGFLDLTTAHKLELLETFDVEQRMRIMLLHIQQRINVVKAQKQINSEVKEKIGERQREMYLREQLQAIRKELGEDDKQSSELKDLRRKLAALDLVEKVRREVDQEIDRLERSQPGSAEAQVIRSYLELIADLPWSKRSFDQLDLSRASQILDEDHYGLKDVKDRVLEFLAIRRLRADRSESQLKSPDEAARDSHSAATWPILLFAGPPGVGKTSVAKSIARAMGREYVRVSLGGVRDEADIRGHRRTYVGAMVGRIIQGLRQAGTKNPVFLLDEVDKLGISFQGDPASALMEVLDPAQNDNFVDHYLNVPFDLSEVLFVTTANYLQNIPGPLLDRMEVVEFGGYTEQEKVKIARDYLIPRQLKDSGLDEKKTIFEDGAIRCIVNRYTREAGVRQLEREIGRLVRKTARKIAAKEAEALELTDESVQKLLGRPKVHPERAGKSDDIGVATGMYYTPAGGDIMFVEVSIRELQAPPRDEKPVFGGLGHVSLILTGQLGDVMKESARAALTYAATHAADLDIPAQRLGAIECHIHVPAGAIPKDGPSAGVTIATALTSAMSGRPVRKDVAMTGEITLRGRVLPIGGIKEKVLGAHRAGIEQIILPAENEADLEDIPQEIKSALVFRFVETLDDVLKTALLPPARLPYSNRLLNSIAMERTF